MTAHSHSTRRKLSLLKLAEELQNVSKACRIMGYHLDTFYEIRRVGTPLDGADRSAWHRRSLSSADGDIS